MIMLEMSFAEFIEGMDKYVIAFAVFVSILSFFSIYADQREKRKKNDNGARDNPSPRIRIIIQTDKKPLSKDSHIDESSAEFVATELTEKEQQAEAFLSLDADTAPIDSHCSVNTYEIDNLIRVMEGVSVTHRDEMAAYATTKKIVNTHLMSDMLSKMEDAKKNLTDVFTKIASKYNDPVSDNPYRMYEGTEYLPLKRKQYQSLKTE